MLGKALELGRCGVQWTPPVATVWRIGSSAFRTVPRTALDADVEQAQATFRRI